MIEQRQNKRKQVRNVCEHFYHTDTHTQRFRVPCEYLLPFKITFLLPENQPNVYLRSNLSDILIFIRTFGHHQDIRHTHNVF